MGKNPVFHYMHIVRKNRILRQGSRYHVSVRVNNKEKLLTSFAAKQIFLTVLCKARKRYKFTIDDYVIMGNHIHLVIFPGKDESLSRIMQWILSVYAMIYNKRFNRSGHFWGERFFSRVIESFFDYLHTFNYIDKNPFVAGLVAKNRNWRFSGAFEHRIGRCTTVKPLPVHLQAFFPQHIRLALPEPK